tara:strand:+ start:83 stop:1180 length:1098 start_codon:yes stop_codon:yes gene_type:complete
MTKKALITGITGQDGSYLAEFLLDKGYIVHGIKRRSSNFNTQRVDHIYQDPSINNRNFVLHFGDLSDTNNINKIIGELEPDEIYNLGAQSHVAVSFETPEYTSDINGLGTLRILESIRQLGLSKKCKFYQASSSELYGLVREKPQNENTQFYPRSPYAVAKLYAYWITINYREAYSIFACNGILFNHESKRRGETFVTRKITRTISRILFGLENCLYLGNLDATRDWGHAKDYVEMQWMILQQDKPDDFVIASGKEMTVREFVEKALEVVGISINWKGAGLNEVAVITNIRNENVYKIKKNDIIVRINKKYFRPSEVNYLLGDPTKAHKLLGWKPSISISNLIKEMMENDLMEAKKQKLLKESKI